MEQYIRYLFWLRIVIYIWRCVFHSDVGHYVNPVLEWCRKKRCCSIEKKKKKKKKKKALLYRLGDSVERWLPLHWLPACHYHHHYVDLDGWLYACPSTGHPLRFLPPSHCSRSLTVYFQRKKVTCLFSCITFYDSTTPFPLMYICSIQQSWYSDSGSILLFYTLIYSSG